MSRSTLYAALVVLGSVLLFSIRGHTQLSQNSGINSNDTWAAFDLTLQTQATISYSTPVYNPATQTTSNTLTTPVSSQTYHIETGYDANGGLVMNLWPGGILPMPISTDEATVSVVRFAGGNVTVFDQNGEQSRGCHL